MNEIIFYILFILSTVILTFCWCFALQQLCITSTKNKVECRRSIFAFSFCTISLFMNIIYYLSSLYPQHAVFPHFEVINLRHLCEGIGILLGSHVYRYYLNWFYDYLYDPMANNIQQPKCIKYTPTIIQLSVSITAITCYICYKICDDIMYVYLFYVILFGIILILMVIFMYIWSKVLNFVNLIVRSIDDAEMNVKVQKRLKYVTAAVCVTVIFAVMDVVVIFIAFDDFNFAKKASMPFNYNKALLGNICYSTFVIIFNIPLLIWAHKRSKCCVIDEDACCSLCGCDMCCYVKDADNVNNSIPLQESGQHSHLSTNAIHHSITPNPNSSTGGHHSNKKHSLNSPFLTMNDSMFENVHAK